MLQRYHLGRVQLINDRTGRRSLIIFLYRLQDFQAVKLIKKRNAWRVNSWWTNLTFEIKFWTFNFFAKLMELFEKRKCILLFYYFLSNKNMKKLSSIILIFAPWLSVISSHLTHTINMFTELSIQKSETQRGKTNIS